MAIRFSSPQTLRDFIVCFSHFYLHCCFRLSEASGVWLARAERGGDGGMASTPWCPLWVASERREVQIEGLMLPWDSPQEEALFSGSHFHAGSIITSTREKGEEKKKRSAIPADVRRSPSPLRRIHLKSSSRWVWVLMSQVCASVCVFQCWCLCCLHHRSNVCNWQAVGNVLCGFFLFFFCSWGGSQG